jgi:hypothetical protein
MAGEYSANIKSFFEDGPVRVISDPEGYHVCQLAHEADKTAEPKNKMLVLGDLMDYTLGGGDNGNNFATIKLTLLREAKSNSFKSIKYCNQHQDKVKVLFGNRDLNKLKLLPLGLITNAEGKYDKWWETGLTYLEAAEQLIEKLKNGSNWAILSMKNWIPFWNAKRAEHWNNDPRLENMTGKMSCLERYYLIFGIDGPHGTMSAQNNLFGVAQECGQKVYNSIFGKHAGLLEGLTVHKTNYLLEIANKPENTDFNKDCVLAAALVFTVYMDALYGIGEPTDGKPFTGVLHRFFNAENTYFCAYAQLGESTTPNLLTFSHGGMRAEFFTNCELKDTAVEYFTNDALLNDAYQKGGYLGTGVETNLSISKITKQINDYNKSMKTTLRKAIDFYHTNLESESPNKFDKPTAELLVNLVISVPHGKGDSCMNSNSSPIMPGIAGYRGQPIVVSDAKLYQFIGHGPIGFAPTIDKYLSKDGKIASYLINLDISNSLFGQFGHLSKEKISTNYSYVEVSFNGTTLAAKSYVNVALNGYAIDIMNGEQKETKTITQLEISGHNLITLLSGKNSTDFFKSDKRTNYHGQITIDTLKYDLFTTADGPPKFTVFLHAIKSYLQGGRSIRRQRKTTSTKRTGKSRAGKLHIRRSNTLVRRKPMMKRTAKK